MLTEIDHIGYVVGDLEAGVATFAATYGTDVAAEIALPQFSLRAAFLNAGSTMIELIEFERSELSAERLDGREVRLDHVAYTVDDIREVAARLRDAGARFCAPDGSELLDPIELGGSYHLWTRPQVCADVCVQFVERPAHRGI